MWESFKRDHSRSYATMEEENQRFGHFLENLKVADLRNLKEKKAGGSASHGVTKFSDLSQAEFESRFLLADKSKKEKNPTVMGDVAAPSSTTEMDWSGVLTTPVKDQGYCGSCWAFSATEQIESDTMRTLATTYILSPEQMVQCDNAAFGCSGGWTESAYGYVKKAGGLALESSYPYTSYQGVTGSCKTGAPPVVTVNSYTTISGETNMANYVLATGPLSVCLDASSWNSYTGGVMSVCGDDVDHCVQAVGVNTASGGWWKVRNSWGVNWGEQGYIRLAYGANTCDITNDPTWTVVALK